MSQSRPFVGIDVAKAHLDIASPQTNHTWQVPNTAGRPPHPRRAG